MMLGYLCDGLKVLPRQSYCVFLSILHSCMLCVNNVTSECVTTGLYSCVILVNMHEGRLQTDCFNRTCGICTQVITYVNKVK
jgi:hypothetical protein